jgi:hypothetical protein
MMAMVNRRAGRMRDEDMRKYHRHRGRRFPVPDEGTILVTGQELDAQ